jgi:hypothetical protein
MGNSISFFYVTLTSLHWEEKSTILTCIIDKKAVSLSK